MATKEEIKSIEQELNESVDNLKSQKEKDTCSGPIFDQNCKESLISNDVDTVENQSLKLGTIVKSESSLKELKKTIDSVSWKYTLAVNVTKDSEMKNDMPQGSDENKFKKEISENSVDSILNENTSAVDGTKDSEMKDDISQSYIESECKGEKSAEPKHKKVPKKERRRLAKMKWLEKKKREALMMEIPFEEADLSASFRREKRKAEEDFADNQDIKKAKLETKALKAKRPGFSEERYNETSYYIENGLRKVYPYYFTFTTFTKGRWVGEKIIDVFAKEFRAHPAQEYERCIKSGTLTVNYEKVDTDYRLKHNDLLANIVHRHETPVLSRNIEIIHLDEDLVVLDKPCSLPVHPCGRYRHNTVVFILAKEYNLKNLRTIHRLDRLTSGLLLFGRTPKKAREMEQQIRTRQVTKEYVCRVEGEFPTEHIECNEPIEVVSYKIGVCKVSPTGKDCRTEFKRLTYNGKTSVVLCRPHTGRMHQIRVHLQFLGYPIVNDPLYNHNVFGPLKGKGGIVGKTDEELIQDLIKIHNAENWLGMDGDSEYSMFKARQKEDGEDEGSQRSTPSPKSPKEKSPPAPRIVSPPTITSTGVIIPSPEHTSPNSPASMDDPKGQGVNFNGTRIGIGATPEEIIKAAQDQQQNPRDYTFRPQLMTFDPHCYECKVKYRDPKPKDLVMFLHALKYSGPGWHYETKLPEWASDTWTEEEV